jgi:hypothetical protein
MDLDRALEIVNDASMNAYCDYVHTQIFRVYGEYEIGFDETYDQVVYAFAYVAVELALDTELLEFVPDDQPRRPDQESTS